MIIRIQYSFCVLHFILTVGRQNLAEAAGTTRKFDRSVHYSTSFIAVVKNRWSYTSTHVNTLMICTGRTLN